MGNNKTEISAEETMFQFFKPLPLSGNILFKTIFGFILFILLPIWIWPFIAYFIFSACYSLGAFSSYYLKRQFEEEIKK